MFPAPIAACAQDSTPVVPRSAVSQAPPSTMFRMVTGGPIRGQHPSCRTKTKQFTSRCLEKSFHATSADRDTQLPPTPTASRRRAPASATLPRRLVDTRALYCEGDSQIRHFRPNMVAKHKQKSTTPSKLRPGAQHLTLTLSYDNLKRLPIGKLHLRWGNNSERSPAFATTSAMKPRSYQLM